MFIFYFGLLYYASQSASINLWSTGRSWQWVIRYNPRLCDPQHAIVGVPVLCIRLQFRCCLRPSTGRISPDVHFAALLLPPGTLCRTLWLLLAHCQLLTLGSRLACLVRLSVLHVPSCTAVPVLSATVATQRLWSYDRMVLYKLDYYYYYHHYHHYLLTSK